MNADYLQYEMHQVERELDARVEHALAAGREVERRTEELERRQGPPEPVTEAEIQRIRAYVMGHARTPEWNLVIERINRGELTWRQIVEGLSTGHLDRSVAAAFDSLSRVPPANVEELIAKGVFPPMPVEQPPAPEQPPAEEQRPPRSRHHRHYDDDDDDYFGNPLQRP